MNTIEYPSTAFPRLPSVRITAADGWEARVVSDALFAVVKERGDDSFATNIVATVARADAAGVADLDEATDEFIASLPEVQRIDRTVAQWGGRDWAVDQFAFIPQGWSTVVQLIARTVVNRGEVHDVVRLTATVDATLVEADFAEITEALGSAVLVEDV